MRWLFIIDPIESLKTVKDSSFAMMVEAARRGHRLFVCEQPAIGYRAGRVRAKAAELTLLDPSGRSSIWWQLSPQDDEALEAFDAVLMRKDPPFDPEYLNTVWLLDRAAQSGARVFNAPRALLTHNEKLAILEFPQFIAPTIVSRDGADLRAFVHEHHEAVFKLLDGMGGTSIFRARRDDPNLSVIIETMTQMGARTVMAQRYLPEIVDGDKRILLIDGEVVPYCLARIPKAGESRGNLAAGGQGEARALTERDREIAEHLAPVLAARGLALVGLDVIGSCLTEINVTSPTCFREIMDQTGDPVAGRFVEAIESRARAPADSEPSR